MDFNLLRDYKNLTPLPKAKLWTAERTLKYMFAALRRSALPTYENFVLITYIMGHLVHGRAILYDGQKR